MEVRWYPGVKAPLVKCAHHLGGALLDSIVGLGAGKTQVECASKENEGELTTFIPLSSLIIFRAVLTFWKWKVKLIYYSTYF